MAGQPSIPSLLRGTLRDLERAYAGQGAGRGDLPPLDLWANLLRVLSSEGRPSRELPAATRLSKRAVRSRLAAAARRGWAREERSDGGPAMAVLTRPGTDVAARWAPLEQAAEAAWAGPGRRDSLRTALEPVVAALPLEHPHYPAAYGATDASITGASITGGPGQDWKPVPRASGGGTTAGLSLSALLAQVLVAYAIDYERLSPVALSASATILRRIPPGGAPRTDLGPAVHLAALERHGFVQPGGPATVILTEKGREASDAYPARVAAVEQSWCETHGPAAITRLRVAFAASDSM